MKKDSLKVFFKVFVRLFSIFAYFCSAAFIGFMLYQLGLPKSVLELVSPLILISHLGLLVALWNEFKGNE